MWVDFFLISGKMDHNVLAYQLKMTSLAAKTSSSIKLQSLFATWSEYNVPKHR